MNALAMPNSSAASDLPDSAWRAEEIAEQLGALVGGGGERFGQRDRVVLRRGGACSERRGGLDMAVALVDDSRSWADYAHSRVAKRESERRRRRRPSARGGPACHRWFRCAIASPIAKNRCCTSSSRRNSTGTRSRTAVRGRRGTAIDELGQPRRVMRAQLRDAQRDAAERQAVRGQHQRVAGSAANAVERIQEAAQRVAVGLDRPDADVGADPRQQHVAGDAARASAARSKARRARANGRSRRSRASRAPPMRTRSPASRRAKARRQFRARRADTGCRAASSAASARRTGRARAEARSIGAAAVAAVLAGDRVRGQIFGLRSSSPAAPKRAASHAALPR